MQFKGFVKKINESHGKSKRPPFKPWVAYSAKLEQENGVEYDSWVSLGFDKPPFKEGDYVELETEESNGREQYIKGTGVVKKNAPARAGKTPVARSASGTGTSTDRATGAASASGPTNSERQASITYQSSRKDALELISLLLEHDALPISGAKTAAGTAKRFTEISEAVDKQTVEFYNDVNSLRVLDRVADAGLVKQPSASSELPDDAEDPDDPDTYNDER